MPIIKSPRLRSGDIESWNKWAELDAAHSTSRKFLARVSRALDDIAEFAKSPCYASVSWGKDSVVMADLVGRAHPSVPLGWVRVEPIVNPESFAVRDQFLLDSSGITYHEIEDRCSLDGSGWHSTGTLERGLKSLADVCGTKRYITGIRGAESGIRKMRCMRHGVATANTCAPLAYWSGLDVFAYLHMRSLPISAVYAMSMGGLLDRDRIRLSSLDGQRGRGHGRAEWERLYFGPDLDRISALVPRSRAP